ncbi:TonB-dependent receptor [Croceicoccus gelatinilyticus]|uniref:TonB-dependent receptor n=1 Tax=Croceicoccus gelatinilyticus TaxID=2835536 RepID=UPI001BCFEC1C|nr:TonB-dependent receptor [Croceicoccus gelatinilyticus]MBS7668184.1 TonB-dependent receptor [Croceicoccus gelatinilyticus]
MTKIHRYLVSGAVGALAMSAAPAFAQDDTAEQPSSGLNEIVVTAQKTAESIQDVPISITAVGGERLSDMQVTTLQALQGSVPNVQIDNFANTPNNAVFTIRGIGVIEPDPYAGNTVSIVVDGVPQFFSMGALLDTYDVQRVEILRGPQGTLFGANTTGGVVNVVTNQPTGEFGGYIKGVYGNWNRFDVSGALEVPIAEDLASFKIAGIHTERDGWVTNVYDGSDMGSKNVDAIRGQLYLTPSLDLSITLQGEYVGARNGAPVVVNGGLPGEANYVPEGTFWNGAELPMYASPCAVAGQPCEAPDKFFSGNNEVPDTSNIDTYFGIATIELANTAIGDITSITGYKEFTQFEYTDQDGTAKTNNATRRRTKGWQLSEEFRTAFESGIISGVAGVFFMKTNYNHYQMYHLDFALPGLIQYNEQDQTTESYSAFLQTYAQVTDRLKLQAGIRFTHDKIDARSTLDTGLGSEALTSPDWDKFDVLFPGSLDVGGKESWDNVGWKLGLDYELGDDALAYASWSRGFKSGGFTGRIGVAADGDTPYNPEEVDTFEVGLKADFFDRTIRTNFAAFYTNYRDMQLAQIYFDPDTNVQGNRILNAAKSEIKGFELEAQAVPVWGLTLRGAVSYLDAKYKDFDYLDPVSTNVFDLTGFRLQNAPEWQTMLGVNYDYEMNSGSRIVADVSWMYTSKKYYTAIVNTPRSTVQPTYLVDALLTYHAPGGEWSAGLWGKNLLDKRYISTVYDSPGYMGIVGYAPPRQYGASLQYNF